MIVDELEKYYKKERLTVGVVTRAQAKKQASESEESKEDEREDPFESEEVDNNPQAVPEIAESTEETVIEITDEEDKEAILKQYHDSAFGGHFGMDKTYDRIKARYHWIGMKKEIERYVKVCLKCQLNKKRKLTKMPLVITKVAAKPFDRLYFDIVEGVPESNQGNNVILSMIDDLTKFVMFEALPDQQASSIAKAIFENVMCRYTIPKEILTDRGNNFRALLVKELCKMLKIKKFLTSPYRPTTNNVERMHSWLGNYLRTIVDTNPANWDEYLLLADVPKWYGS
ncbi:hypothetical protein HA402_006558 [Bradysia odoriphaga]|nr:hypothetical protein HA402_006558 [Bradysia odoriphaga]